MVYKMRKDCFKKIKLMKRFPFTTYLSQVTENWVPRHFHRRTKVCKLLLNHHSKTPEGAPEEARTVPFRDSQGHFGLTVSYLL